MSQEAPVVDYETAAKELTYERAPAWRPEAFEQHPRVIAGVVVRVNRRVTDQSAADIFTIETGLAQGGTEKQPAWSIWAFDPQQGQEPSRKTRLLRELELKVGDHVMASYGGRKQFSDGSGKTWHAFEFQRVATAGEDDVVPPEPDAIPY